MNKGYCFLEQHPMVPISTLKTFIVVCFHCGSECPPCKYLVFVSNGTVIKKAVQLKLVLMGVRAVVSQITVVKFNVLIIPDH